MRIVSPYAPGGLGDLLPRAVATALTDLLGQQVIVENRPGASMIIGTQAAAKSPPDGHTLAFGSVTSLAINVSAQKKPALRPGEGLRAGLALFYDAALPGRPSLAPRQIRQGADRAGKDAAGHADVRLAASGLTPFRAAGTPSGQQAAAAETLKRNRESESNTHDYKVKT